jgi:hypothetical protein
MNILIKIVEDAGKDILVGAEDALHFLATEEPRIVKASPAVLAALGTLAGGIEKAVSDVATDAANPLSVFIALPAQLADFVAVWPELKQFFASLGITKA